MSSINTSNNLGIQSLIQAGKQPVDPNRNPLQRANTNTQRTGSGDASTEGKVAVDPNRNPLTAAHDNTEAAARQGSAPTQREAQALDTAQKLVSTTLIKPILANARAARDAPAPWGQTQAEKQFGALLDNRIADDIAKASNFPIAQRIADQILKNSPVIDQPQHYTPTDIFG